MSDVCIIYNDKNKLKMNNIYSSLQYQFHNYKIDFLNKPNNNHKVIVTDKCNFFNKKAVLIISSYRQNINKITKNNLPIIIQYESEIIKKYISNSIIKNIENVIINAIPKQKSNIKPLDSQSSTIFYQGLDKEEDMVDLMFNLDLKTHYEILFYKNDCKENPSKMHKLSWCVSKNKNVIGIISYKIITEIENGCLPILIKEYMPKYFFAYPFYVSLSDLKNKDRLINRVKEISTFIAKMKREDFSFLANSIYNSIYIESRWKYNYYRIVEKIKYTLD